MFVFRSVGSDALTVDDILGKPDVKVNMQELPKKVFA
jgi:hypothetical protein